MITNIKEWEEFEKNLLRNKKPNYQNNLKIFRQLYEEAVLLKAFPSRHKVNCSYAERRISKVPVKV
jgi:hypothetical protein